MSTQLFSTPGTFTFTVPPAVTTLQVEAWGGGGNGDDDQLANGGGGGGYGKKNSILCSSGDEFLVIVGAGGAVAGAGEDSAFSGNPTPNYMQVPGGASGASGGAGGSTGSGADVDFNGGNGGLDQLIGGGGGGGSSAGTGADGGNGADATVLLGGAGGGAPSGGAGGGGGGDPGSDGTNGFAPGGGGGSSGTGSSNAGLGADGQVLLTWIEVYAGNGALLVGTVASTVSGTLQPWSEASIDIPQSILTGSATATAPPSGSGNLAVEDSTLVGNGSVSGPGAVAGAGAIAALEARMSGLGFAPVLSAAPQITRGRRRRWTFFPSR